LYTLIWTIIHLIFYHIGKSFLSSSNLDFTDLDCTRPYGHGLVCPSSFNFYLRILEYFLQVTQSLCLSILALFFEEFILLSFVTSHHKQRSSLTHPYFFFFIFISFSTQSLPRLIHLTRRTSCFFLSLSIFFLT
jgi:hypothetical protein